MEKLKTVQLIWMWTFPFYKQQQAKKKKRINKINSIQYIPSYKYSTLVSDLMTRFDLKKHINELTNSFKAKLEFLYRKETPRYQDFHKQMIVHDYCQSQPEMASRIANRI